MTPITCVKCAFVNRYPAGVNLETCPKCSVIYSKAVATIRPPVKAPASKRRLAFQKLLKHPELIPIILPVSIAGIAGILGCFLPHPYGIWSSRVGLAAIAFMVLVMLVKNSIANSMRMAVEKQNRDSLYLSHGHTRDDMIFNSTRTKSIVIDEPKQSVFLYSIGSTASVRQVCFSDIMRVDLHEDGESISTTSGGASIGRAVIGRALFGVAGEVIGGTTARRTTKSVGFVDLIELRLQIKDIKNPIWDRPRSAVTQTRAIEKAIESVGPDRDSGVATARSRTTGAWPRISGKENPALGGANFDDCARTIVLRKLFQGKIWRQGFPSPSKPLGAFLGSASDKRCY